MNFNLGKRSRRVRLALALTVALVATAATGCSSEGNERKQQVLDGLDRQLELAAYRFDGSLALDQHQAWGESEDEPLTTAVLQTIKQGTLRWDGVTDRAAQRTDASLEFSPVNGPVIDLSVILNDSAAYVQLPKALQGAGAFKLQLDGQTAGLDASAATIAEIGKSLIRSVRGRDFEAANDGGDAESRLIRVELGRKQLLAAVREFGKHELDHVLERLTADGVITAEQAERFRNAVTDDPFVDRMKNIRIEEPGLLEFELDGDGLLRMVRFSLLYEWDGQEPESVAFDYRIEPLEEGSFEQPIPEHAVDIGAWLKQPQPESPSSTE